MPEDDDLHSIVLCLGGFHTIMSFLGCIGHIMSGCGLQDVLEQLYASNAVTHILSGKAVERAIRGHFLIDAALNAMLISKAFDVNLSTISWLEDLPINNSSSQENNNLEEQPEMFDGGASQENNHLEEQPSEARSLLLKFMLASQKANFQYLI